MLTCNYLVLTLAVCMTMFCAAPCLGRQIHISPNGDDTNDGSPAQMLKTISAAAELAQPGDTVVVHEGVYRERVSPPRGGTSDDLRITYQAASGEKVVITGSESIKGWSKVSHDTWKVVIPNTFFGDFNPYSDLIHGDWYYTKDRQNHTGAVYLDGDWLIEAADLDAVLQPVGDAALWFAQVNGPDATEAPDSTVIWAQFKDVDPNDADVEINVRKTVFTPQKAGIDYITLRGFVLRNAATNWAPPTAGQIGMVTAYWCKGWIIEDNDIGYSRCCGVALGKYADEWENAQSAKGYRDTITRALDNGWNRQTVGSHLVRNNHVHHCEQAGIVGSMGCAFSTVTGNVIHDIHVQELFSGAEMGGIKFHGAIDTVISGNHIYRCGGSAGIWLDWMGQGAQVTDNLMHDNIRDVFFEMQHGPLLLANNILLSPEGTIWINADNLAIAHNLVAGRIKNTEQDSRKTPAHTAHATEIAGQFEAISGSHRFYNNLFVGPADLQAIDNSKEPCVAAGNVFTVGSHPSKFDSDALSATNFDPGIKLTEQPDGWYLTINLDSAWGNEHNHQLVTTELLGKAACPNVPYDNRDGSPLSIDTDYFGRPRNTVNPFPGPFELQESGPQVIRVWPIDNGTP